MKHIFCLFALICLISISTTAQNIAVNALVKKAKASKDSFINTDKVFKTVAEQKKISLEKKLPKELECFGLLDVKIDKINDASLLSSNIILNIPFEENLEVELVEVDIFTASYKNTIMPNGKEYTPKVSGKHYWGRIKDNEKSTVAISVFNDEIMGLISSEDNGNLVIGKLKNSKEHIIYQENDINEFNNFSCFTPPKNVKLPNENQKNTNTNKAMAAECIGIHYDVGVDIINDKGSVDGALEFIYGAFSQVAMIYANEGISVKIEGTTTWTNAEPFKYSADVGLDSYRNYRTSNNWTGSVAHYVHYNGGGGMAYVNALCSNYYGYGTNGINSYYSNVPTYSWTVYVLAHELGHNFGSPHTQSCSWDGGPLDNCVSPEDGNCSPGPAPTNGGTVMSYCHLTNYGVNYYEGFGQQPGDLIRYYYNNASCKFDCDGEVPVTANCNDGIQNQGEDGIDCGGPCTPCPCINGTNVTVTISLDSYPAETSWSIINENGQTVDSGSGYNNANSTINSTSCLADGCYNFVINDSYGDGICCGYGNGSYSITSNGETLASGGSFTNSETTNFCLNDTPSNESCNDGIQNQGETGIDCGGPCAPCQEPCNLNLVCEYRINASGGWNNGDCSAEVCVGDELVLSANPNGLPSYQWTSPNGFSGKGGNGGDILVSNNINSTHAGTYTVVATDDKGCEAIKTLTVIVSACIADADNDGVPDNQDQCPGQNDNIIGNSCNDGNNCTINDKYDNNCTCIGEFLDDDGDGVCNYYDICPTGNDNLDSDNDGIPDACDTSTNIAEGCYFFEFKHSGKYLSAASGAGQKGNVEQSDYFGGNDEKFEIVKSINNDGYYIYSYNSENGLEVASSGGSNGDNVAIWKVNLSANHHRWYFEDVGNGYFKLQNKNSGKFLDVSGISTAQGANVHQWQSTNGDNQRFKLISCSTPPNIVISDSDNDGVPDSQDQCPGQNDNIIGNACNDGDPCTINDTYNSNCQCVGLFQDSDNDGICNANDNTNGNCTLNGSCNDGDSCTINDTYNSNCQCVGLFQDSDNDGICNSNDNTNGNCALNTSCNDGDVCTINDVYNSNCECIGTFQDSDNDGVCDAFDVCAGFNDMLDFDNDGIPDDCDITEFDLSIAVRVYLEGFFQEIGQMSTVLNFENLIPNLQPFTDILPTYQGVEYMNNIPSTMVDWVLVKIHNSNGDVISERPLILKKNGYVNDLNGSSSLSFVIPAQEDYKYLSVHHKSHLPIIGDISSISFIDFSQKENVLGINQTVEKYGKQTMISGDFDCNGLINNLDYNVWGKNNAQINQYLSQDADGNGIINNLDFNFWDMNKSKIGHPMIQN